MADMPMSAAPGAVEDIRIGRVMNRSFEVLSRHFLTFPLLALIPYLAIFVVVLLLGLAVGAGRTPHPAIGTPSLGVVFFGILVGFLVVAVWVIAQAMIFYGAFQDMRGRPVLIGQSAKIGLERVVPVIGLAICLGFTVGLGFIFFLIPGVILATMFYVALPVCVVEGQGPLASLGRSAALTKGHRSKVFGLALALSIISLIGNFVISRVLGVLGGSLIGELGTLIWISVLGAYQAITVAVLYHDLRVAKEGIDIEQMAAVFN